MTAGKLVLEGGSFVLDKSVYMHGVLQKKQKLEVKGDDIH